MTPVKKSGSKGGKQPRRIVKIIDADDLEFLDVSVIGESAKGTGPSEACVSSVVAAEKNKASSPVANVDTISVDPERGAEEKNCDDLKYLTAISSVGRRSPVLASSGDKEKERLTDQGEASAGFLADLSNTVSTKGCLEGPKLDLILAEKHFFDPPTLLYNKTFGMKAGAAKPASGGKEKKNCWWVPFCRKEKR